MAKKDESGLSYMQLPLPESRKYYKTVKRSWGGLNYVQTADSGAASAESNISTLEFPYLVPSQSPESLPYSYANPIGIFGFDDFLLVIYRKNTSVYIDYLKYKNGKYQKYTGTLSDAADGGEYPRCVVKFNVYDTPTDPVSGKYVKKLLIFPDKKSMDFDITSDNFKLSGMTVAVREYSGDGVPPDSASRNYYYRNSQTSEIYKWVDDPADSENSGWKLSAVPNMPDIRYAAVHLSRLFGVDDERVYASGYNDYTNWNLDTIDEYNESNAWCSPAQSNTKAGGSFTGITNFQGHIVCFKRDFMHEIYNTKNPFRIQDIYAQGTIDGDTVQDVDGRLIFVSEDGVKLYTGASPRSIGRCLNIRSYVYAKSGSDGRLYYLYCEDAEGGRRLFVYDTLTEYWSEEAVDCRVLGFAHNQNGMYMLTSDGEVLKLDSGEYDHDWSFETELITNATVDIKHIKKLQLFADIAKGAKVRVYLLYDGEEFDPASATPAYESTSFGQKPIRVKPRMSAHYGVKLRIEGRGYVKLYSLELCCEPGGDLYA